MGTAFDDPMAASATKALEGAAPTNDAQREAQLARRLLVASMTGAGFTNYPEEWWHWDFGNAFWRHYGGLEPGPVFRTVVDPEAPARGRQG